MPLVKHHSKMVKASCLQLISSLFSATLSQDVLFLQPHQLQCLPLGDTFVYSCAPFFSLLYTAWVTICSRHIKALLENSKTNRLKALLTLFLICWECYVMSSKWLGVICFHVSRCFKSENEVKSKRAQGL